MDTIDVLLIVLEQLKSDKNAQVVCLQSYISNYGPIPDEYGDKVKALINPDPDSATITEIPK